MSDIVITDMQDGDVGFIRPWAITAHHGRYWIKFNHCVSSERGGTISLRVEKRNGVLCVSNDPGFTLTIAARKDAIQIITQRPFNTEDQIEVFLLPAESHEK